MAAKKQNWLRRAGVIVGVFLLLVAAIFVWYRGESRPSAKAKVMQAVAEEGRKIIADAARMRAPDSGADARKQEPADRAKQTARPIEIKGSGSRDQESPFHYIEESALPIGAADGIGRWGRAEMPYGPETAIDTLRQVTVAEFETRAKKKLPSTVDQIWHAKGMDWDRAADQVEKFLLQEPWDLPRLSFSELQAAEAIYLHESRLKAIRLAILRAERAGDSEKAERIFLRQIDFLRYSQVCRYPFGMGSLAAEAIFATAGDGPWLKPDVAKRAAEILERARLSGDQFHRAWPGFVADVQTRASAAFDQSWIDVRERPYKIIARALLPLAQRQTERLAAAYADADDQEIKRLRSKLGVTFTLMSSGDAYTRQFDQLMDIRRGESVAQFHFTFDGDPYNAGLDEARLVLAFLLYRAGHGSNPASIGDLPPLPAATIPATRPATSWKMVTVESHLAWNPDAPAPPGERAHMMQEAKLALYDFRTREKHPPANIEDVQPYLAKRQVDLEKARPCFVGVPETPVFVRVETQKIEASTFRDAYGPYARNGPEYLAGFPVYAWPDEDLLRFLK